jgi:SecD/SecF fusion protein
MRWFALDDLRYWYNNARELRAIEANPSGFFAARGYIVEPRDGQYFMLAWDTSDRRLLASEGDWGLRRAYQSIDAQSGRPSIAFEMDARGAVKLGDMTGENVGRQMAVVLDDRVITAPTLQSRISRNGQITGQFAPSDLEYLSKTMSAGSLQAKLSEEPLSLSVLGPELGADNLRAGYTAAILALIAVSIFMVLYYLGHGFIALLALMVNAVIILGAMALNRNSFTLPGIAGIVLTFGMAVDANVLIYERIREEMGEGADLKTAVRLAYQKVLSTILDANITNFIVCLVLLYTATQEIKGFAITLMIGIVATLFSTLFVTRIVYTWLIDRFGVRKMPQLPQVIPVIQSALSPRVNWLKLRPVFLIISIGYIGLGIAMIGIQQEEMLDNEFRGGTKVTVQLSEEDAPKTRQEIEDRLDALPEGERLLDAEILPENPEDDGVTSDRFIIKTVDQNRVRVQETVGRALSDWLDAQPALEFVGSDARETELAPIFPVLDGTLGASIGRPEVRNDVADYLGGAAIVLENIDPAVSEEDIVARIAETRRKEDFSRLLNQDLEVIITDGTDEAATGAVIIVSDPDVGFFDDEVRWRGEVSGPNWAMTRAALAESGDFVAAESFSAQVAATRQAQAIVAVILSLLFVMVYIWFRFGSLRYSMAAIAALVHDVLAVVGLIAAAELLYAHAPALAIPLMIEPFKIDLGLIAALLTIIGYSLNDTIVILDRIRENRGRLTYASADVVNLSINQTISRTIITSGTTLAAVLTMYIQGGTGIRSFTYALLCGVIVGTYSSIAVAAPLVYSKKGDRQAARREAELAASRDREAEPVGA